MSVNSNIAQSQPIGERFHENSRRTDNIPLVDEKSINSKMENSLLLSHLSGQEIIPQRVHISENNPCERTSVHSEGRRQVLNNNTPYLVYSESVDKKTASLAESMLTDALFLPSAIHINDIIGSTLDEKELMFIKEKLTDKYSTLENPVTHALPKSSRLLDTSNVSHIHSDKECNFANNKDAEKLANNPEQNLSSTKKTEVSIASTLFCLFLFCSFYLLTANSSVQLCLYRQKRSLYVQSVPIHSRKIVETLW